MSSYTKSCRSVYRPLFQSYTHVTIHGIEYINLRQLKIICCCCFVTFEKFTKQIIVP